MGISEAINKINNRINVMKTSLSMSGSSSSKGEGAFKSTPKNNDSYSSSSSNSKTSSCSTYSVGVSSANNGSINEQLDNLKKQKTDLSGNLESKSGELTGIYNGTSPAIQSQQAVVDAAKEAYDQACDESLNPFVKIIKKQQDENEYALMQDESSINTAKQNLLNLGQYNQEISNQLNSLKSSLGAYEAQLSNLNSIELTDENKASVEKQKAEIQAKISEIEQQINEKEESLKNIQESIKEQEASLKKSEEAKKQHLSEREKYAKMIDVVANEQIFNALKAYQDAQQKLEEIKTSEENRIQEELSQIQDEISNIEAKMESLEEQKMQEECNKALEKKNFGFKEKMSDTQERDLEQFKEKYEQNKDRYKAIEDATGVPAELVAAIHWRESNGNFNTYVQNGDPLGQPTTHVPTGIMCNTWEESAIKAFSDPYFGKIDKDDMQTYYDYAERYNGLGYKNRGVPSAYVWAGTSKYTSGKFVADGTYSASTVDQQLGVALMLKTLMS